jgi:hypothetical protein
MLSRECSLSLESPRGGHERRGGPERIPRWREACEWEKDGNRERRGADSRGPLEEKTAERY